MKDILKLLSEALDCRSNKRQSHTVPKKSRKSTENPSIKMNPSNRNESSPFKKDINLKKIISSAEASIWEKFKEIQGFCKVGKKSLQRKIKEEKKQQAREEENKAKEEFFELLGIRHTDEDLICPVCLKFIAHSTCLTCGHSYCEQCLEELQMIVPDCLVCGKRIKRNREFGKCRSMDSIIENVLSTMELEEELEDLRRRKINTLNWKMDKDVPFIEVGNRVDIRSPEFIWCVGVIRRIAIRADKRIRVALVHYEGFPNSFDEEIPENSPRLAKHRFFTGREGTLIANLDIPKLIWTQKGTKMITMDGVEVGYDILGNHKNVYAALVDSDESDAY